MRQYEGDLREAPRSQFPHLAYSPFKVNQYISLNVLVSENVDFFVRHDSYRSNLPLGGSHILSINSGLDEEKLSKYISHKAYLESKSLCPQTDQSRSRFHIT